MIWLIVVSVILAFFAFAGLSVAPYVPIRSRDVAGALDLFESKAGQVLVDLGSGDGRILKEAARRGLMAVGYEINPVMCLVAWLSCWSYRSRVHIKCRSLWAADLSEADLVYAFLIPKRMAKLDEVLNSQNGRALKLVSYAFQVPERRYVRFDKNSYLYYYPVSAKKTKHS